MSDQQGTPRPDQPDQQPGPGWAPPGYDNPGSDAGQPGYPGAPYPGQTSYPGPAEGSATYRGPQDQAGAPDYAGYQPVPGYPPAPDPGRPGPGGYPSGYPAVGGYGPGYPALALRNDYASWIKRVGAMLIDQVPTYVGLIVFYVGYAMWIVTVSRAGGTPSFTAGAVPMIVGAVIMLAGFGWTVYNRWIVAGRTGQSLGKRVTKITLVSEQTSAPIGTMNAFLRDLVHILDGAAYIGYLWPLWDPKRQTFADKIMNTVVVDAPDA